MKELKTQWALLKTTPHGTTCSDVYKKHPEALAAAKAAGAGVWVTVVPVKEHD